ncbi:MAG TPA: hypothetical protein VL422_08025 [Miltoncostaea sp.]|nr:hypothetical protein [Miltoncostaea sp.]
MTGVIWFVQVVHYPLLALAGEEGFASLAAAHQRRTGWVVGPPMAVEGVTAVALLVWRPDGVPAAAVWAGVALVAAIWIATWAMAVPRHRELARGWDPDAHRRLVAGNRLRTALWTARAGLVLGMVAAAAA